jgi:hypothetical protein
MAKDGTVLPAAKYTRGGGAGATISDQAADDRVLDLLAGGATLVLQALHRTWPPLVDFAGGLARELGHPVQVNAYITPSQNQGFAAHYDTHDVFVLQVAGTKHWYVHAPVVPDPLPDQPWQDSAATVAARATEPPEFDAVLKPGDALYLPRGYIHSATALGRASIHLTVGVHPLTRHDLVRHLLALLPADPSLRSSLPIGRLADPEVLAPHLAQTLEHLHRRLDRVDARAVAQRLGAQLAQQSPPEPLGPLAQLEAASAVGPVTPLRLRSGLHLRLDHAGEGVCLRLPEKTITFPAVAEAALKAILSGDAFAPAELPGLDASERLVVARRLLREGVLVPAAR